MRHCKGAESGQRITTIGLSLLMLFMAAGTTQASFRLFDAFEDEILGPVDGQDGWDSSGGDIQVVVDPAGAGNHALYVSSESSVLRKSLLLEGVAVPDGTVRMLFMRLRVGNKQTFSLGLSQYELPTQYDDFAPEIGMANSAENLDLRAWDDDGNKYEFLTQLASNRWYNVWVLIDASLNHYQIWLNDLPGGGATAADKLTASDADETFDFRSGRNSDLVTFYVKTSGGTSGINFGPVYFDDIYVDVTDALNLTNPTDPDSTAEVRELLIDHDKESLLWGALTWADRYDVVKGDLRELRETGGDFAVSVTSCLENDAPDTSAQDPELPDDGRGFFYLVCGITESGEPGTYDTGGPEQVASRDPGVADSLGACP